MTYGWEYATEMTLSPHCRGGLSEMPAVVTKIPKALGPPRRNSSWKEKKKSFSRIIIRINNKKEEWKLFHLKIIQFKTFP